jgi:hypothetical protein
MFMICLLMKLLILVVNSGGVVGARVGGGAESF